MVDNQILPEMIGIDFHKGSKRALSRLGLQLVVPFLAIFQPLRIWGLSIFKHTAGIHSRATFFLLHPANIFALQTQSLMSIGSLQSTFTYSVLSNPYNNILS